MYTLTTRAQTAEEQQRIGSQSRTEALGNIGCLAILTGALPIWLLGKLGGWIGWLFNEEWIEPGQWLGRAAGAIFFVCTLASFLPYLRRLQRRAQRDREDGVVDEIHVTSPRVVEIGLLTDNEPILAFQIGADKILFLQGQWLREATTYGINDVAEFGDEYREDDAFIEYVNAMPPPHAFPSTEFTITRFPTSGEVVGIRVAGDYLPPERTVEALKFEYEFCESELFDGKIDDIAAVLAQEHTRRQVSR